MVDRKKMLVAYEMGLGKTAMSIAALEGMRDTQDLDGPILVICLSSLKYQWQKEIVKFSDSTSTVVDGSKTKRTTQWAESTDYIICNYEAESTTGRSLRIFSGVQSCAMKPPL